MDLILFVVIFIVVLAVIQSLFMLLRSGRFNPEVGRLRKEIKGLSADRAGAGGVDIVKKRTLSSIPWLNEVAARPTRCRRSAAWRSSLHRAT